MSKWRGSSEFCSEECKQKSQEEFNQLAMSRLMQPRLARAQQRGFSATATVRTVESGSGRLTVVTHPIGASIPILTEPPECGFIMEASAILTALQLRHQPPVTPRAAFPVVPQSEFSTGDALRVLEATLADTQLGIRAKKRISAFSQSRVAWAELRSPEPPIPACELSWRRSLGLEFGVIGLDHAPRVAESKRNGTPFAASQFPELALSVAELETSSPNASEPGTITHVSIPSRRPARAVSIAYQFEIGTERLLTTPSITAPRMRIHLPKPLLQPLCPRFAIAPRPAEEPIATTQITPEAAPNKPETAEPKPVEPETAVAPPAPKSSTEGKAAPKVRVPIVTAKVSVEPKPEPKSESFAVPSFGGASVPAPEGLWNRTPVWQKAVAALVIVGIAVAVWAVPAVRRASSPPVSAATAIDAAPGGLDSANWSTDSAADKTGLARQRRISQYKPTRAKRDYTLEFAGHIEQRAIGWVFRMKDSQNYYCLKLEQVGDQASASVQLVKFAVIDGEEQTHRLVPLRQRVLAGQLVKVRLDVRGQSFTTQLNGASVDAWTDNQISDGAVGFSNESGERAVIRTVKVSY